MKSTYIIKNVEIKTDKVLYIRDDMVVSLSIMEDYINRKFPIILLDLMLDSNIINSIINYKSQATLKLEIYENTISSDSEDIIDTKIYIKDTFSIILKNESTDYRILNDLNGLPEKERLDQYSKFSVYLIKMEDTSYFTKEHSLVFRNISRADVLKAILKMKDIPSKTAIATPPKDGILEQVIVPQGDLISNINYVNDKYGLYVSKPIIYKDLFNLYCLCTYDPNILLVEGIEEYNILFVIPDDRSNSLIKNGYVIDKDMKLFEVHTNVYPTIRDMSQTISKTQFGTIMTVDESGKVEKTTLDNSTNKLKYVYKDNDLSSSQIINSNYSSSKKVEIDISDTSLRYFKPYKICTMLYPQELNNTYNVNNVNFIINSIATSFVKNGTSFNITSHLVLSDIKSK